MNWAIVIGIVLGALVIGLIILLRERVLGLIVSLCLIGLGCGIMWVVYKWIFAEGWNK